MTTRLYWRASHSPPEQLCIDGNHGSTAPDQQEYIEKVNGVTTSWVTGSAMKQPVFMVASKFVLELVVGGMFDSHG